ncbi:CLUMA_CG020803, isoform A [Clunio marinus]|uniref:CLUMA_CG020803, isoform A n=1 Tax=Clunio marinus TaxID=568069 RepID=A0A1J1J9Z7_9DIPT|nr:CLUMA_CG020803, isoform A [Clunio marinus]
MKHVLLNLDLRSSDDSYGAVLLPFEVEGVHNAIFFVPLFLERSLHEHKHSISICSYLTMHFVWPWKVITLWSTRINNERCAVMSDALGLIGKVSQ